MKAGATSWMRIVSWMWAVLTWNMVDIEIGRPVGNYLPGIERFVELPGLTAAECNNSELIVAGDEALGAEPVEKFYIFQPGAAESLLDIFLIGINQCRCFCQPPGVDQIKGR